MTAEPRTSWVNRGLIVSTVVVVIAIIAAPRLMRLLFRGKPWIAVCQCKEYYDAANHWQRTKGRAPDSLEEMEEPLNKGDVDFIRVEDDPWGNLYVLEIKIEGLLVRSFGPDGKRGTADDITYPPQE